MHVVWLVAGAAEPRPRTMANECIVATCMAHAAKRLGSWARATGTFARQGQGALVSLDSFPCVDSIVGRATKRPTARGAFSRRRPRQGCGTWARAPRGARPRRGMFQRTPWTTTARMGGAADDAMGRQRQGWGGWLFLENIDWYLRAARPAATCPPPILERRQTWGRRRANVPQPRCHVGCRLSSYGCHARGRAGKTTHLSSCATKPCTPGCNWCLVKVA